MADTYDSATGSPQTATLTRALATGGSAPTGVGVIGRTFTSSAAAIAISGATVTARASVGLLYPASRGA